jgi:TrmH family RNA methyltransferase
MIVKPHVVLVRPKYPRNIGFCSRAMANMGGGELILIERQCEINLEARQGAAGAQTRLIEAREFKSWQAFIENTDEGALIAFSGKPGKEHDNLTFHNRLEWISQNDPQVLTQNIYFIFGPEDDGLSKSELQDCNFIHALPTYGEFLSLNISHAVLVSLFIYWEALTEKSIKAQASTALQEKLLRLKTSLGEWLLALGFQTNDRSESALTVLNRVLLKNLPTTKEMRVLAAIIEQTLRKLKK